MMAGEPSDTRPDPARGVGVPQEMTGPDDGVMTVAASPTAPFWRLAVMIVLVGAVALAFVVFRDRLTLAALAGHEARLREMIEQFPVSSLVVAFLIYVAAAAIALPGAGLLSIAYGWFFGFWRGLVLVSLASTTGATLCFLLSRFFLRSVLQAWWGDRLAAFHRSLEEEGAFYLFTLRTITVVPFFMINLVMGLTPLRAWTFYWVSLVGMLPGTVVHVAAGTAMPSLSTLIEQGAKGLMSPALLAALIALGLLPLVAKKLVEKFRRSRN